MWLETCGDDLTPRAALRSDYTVDVAVVGAGFTGLWTAYHLIANDPGLRVAIVEREIAGWGASGRNGGWCSALFATPWSRIEKDHSRDGALALRSALERTVDDVGRWCDNNRVDAHFVKGGTLVLARGAAQAERVRREVEVDRGHGGDETRWLDAGDVQERLSASKVDGAMFNPHCAAIQPARLARGLARVVERLGVNIYEHTPAVAIDNHAVTTPSGRITADVVVQATEGYTATLAGRGRTLAPVWSLIVATEPLPANVWSELVWAERETVTDGRHVIIYAQRTADDRIVFGGRGAPYRFGSRTDGAAGHARTFRHLDRELRELFPAVRNARITHRWGGVLGVPRDWMPSVGFDRAAGFAWGGGYVGDGVGCSALAGKTIAELVLDLVTPDTRLPWVGHRWRAWEPEPLRWLGIHAVSAVFAGADRSEARSGRQSRLAGLANRTFG